jgi:hypothetical protein
LDRTSSFSGNQPKRCKETGNSNRRAFDSHPDRFRVVTVAGTRRAAMGCFWL